MRVVKLSFAWIFAAAALVTFWTTAGLIHTNFYTGGDSDTPSLPAKAFTMSMFLAVGSVLLAAWWTAFRNLSSSRKWAIAASSCIGMYGFLLVWGGRSPLWYVGWSTLIIGVGGIFAFGLSALPDSSPAAQMTDRASGHVEPRYFSIKFVTVIAPVAVFLGNSLWFHWSLSHRLDLALPPYYYGQLILMVLLITVLHEGGHLLAGLALRMKPILLAVGPLVCSNTLGKWKIQMRFTGLKSFFGQTQVVPKDIRGFRERKILQVAVGPFVSLATGAIAGAAVLGSLGTAWQNSWMILSEFATLSVVVGLFNLIPFRIGSEGYSDGAKLYQLLQGGLLCDYQRLIAMTHACACTPIRPREYDIATIRRAAGYIATGYGELFMHLCAYGYFLDRCEPSEAATELAAAEAFCEQSELTVPTDWLAVFVFGHAFVRRDPVAARARWEALVATGQAELTGGNWISYAALLWIEGRSQEAEQAWQNADAWAKQMPDSGFAASERQSALLLRRAMDGIE